MHDPSPDSLDQRLDAPARQTFRAKFRLRGRELAPAERCCVVDVIAGWIQREMTNPPGAG
jgi:hypothetical protein